MTAIEIVEISRLGAKGDGVALANDRPIYLPFTLPGERVEISHARGGACLEQVVEASADRVAPVCRHFGACGGCALQHMAEPAYLAWKRSRIVEALASLSDMDARTIVAPVCNIGTGERRRAVFTAMRAGGRALFGFLEAKSHRVVAIDECPVLVPDIANCLSSLRQVAASVGPARGRARIHVTSAMNGLDVVVEGGGEDLAPASHQRLAEIARSANIARIHMDGELLFQLEEPRIKIGGVEIVPPPGTFLQASSKAEAAMQALVAEGVAGAGHIVDLFCGIGTFSLALASSGKIRAYDCDGPAVDALAKAARRLQGAGDLLASRRDLFRDPLTPRELKGVDAAIFDPPRAGAVAQVAQLARSDVNRLVALSCNLTTFVRDLEVLVKHGFRVLRVTPIDQFVFSPHVELVGVLERH